MIVDEQHIRFHSANIDMMQTDDEFYKREVMMEIKRINHRLVTHS